MAEPRRADSGPRPIWSGTISFGLVSVPVYLYPGNRPGGISLRMLAPDGAPLRRQYYCPEDERKLDPDDLVRGWETDDGDWITIEDEELEALAPRKSRDIDLTRFVEREAIDPLFFERSYYLTPAGENVKAYRLLADAMERRGQAGMATFVMRGKEYLAAILADGGILRLETLRFTEEIRSAAGVGLKKAARPTAAAAKTLRAAVRKRTARELPEEDPTERRTERILQIVESKRKRDEDIVEAPEVDEDEDKVVDLMQVLRERLRKGERAPARSARRARRS